MQVMQSAAASKKQYPERVRKFCLALHYYSPRAYEFVRQTLNFRLPHTKTIQCWYAASDLRGDPGIQEETIARLKKCCNYYKEANIQPICTLMFDEMSIRSQVFWSQLKLDYVGLASTNNVTTADANSVAQIARQAIVFMLNGINISFDFPVAYYLINSIDKEQRKELLLEVIKAVTVCGIRIVAVAFDGLPSNFAMCELLGAHLNPYSPTFKTTFKNPVTNDNIYIILDPPHMEKLARNTLGTRKIMLDADNQKIEWKYIELLYEYSKQFNLRTHKLSKKHIQFDRNPMNVRLAAQTFSDSVAKSMQFLKEQSHPEFKDSGATIEFVKIMNTLFDICNGRHQVSTNIFKRPLSDGNTRVIFDCFDSYKTYFKNLKVSEKDKFVPVLKSTRRTAFRGYFINMHSIRLMYQEFVEEKKLLTSLPTYYLSQDALERFFGNIRANCGFNNNPNVEQFKGAYRKLQCNMDLAPSKTGNCRALDTNLPDKISFSNIYFISSRRSSLEESNYEDAYENQKNAILEAVVQLDSLEACNPLLDVSRNFSIAFIASSIEKKIINCPTFYCGSCQLLFQENDKLILPSIQLLDRIPTKSTFEICKTAERYFALIDIQKGQKKFNFKAIYCLIFRSMNFDTLYANTSFECEVTHKYQFIKCIVGEYITIRATYASRDVTYDQFRTMLRQQLNRLVLQSGQ